MDTGEPGRRAAEAHQLVGYVLSAFANHHALEVSPWAIFQFSRGIADSISVDVRGQPLSDLNEHHRQLDEEGQGREVAPSFPEDQVERFRTYQPASPPRLYGMHKDQVILAVEGDDDIVFEVGRSMTRYAPELARLNSGKK